LPILRKHVTLSSQIPMQHFLPDFSLTRLNTFGIQVKCAWFAQARTPEDFKILYPQIPQDPLLILGGGSNILFTRDFPGTVIQNCIEGIHIISQTETSVLLRAGAGVIWNDLVNYCVENEMGGIENLALIPGTCGAAPIQNIGAYGVELKDVLHSVELLRLEDWEIIHLDNEACKFSYRNSIFKQEAKGNYIILSICLKLDYKSHNLNLSYSALANELSKRGIQQANIRDIRNAVVDIRSSKLPDPAVTGNAGSFFKNPEIPELLFLNLKNEYPEIVSFPTQTGMVKIAAGWLIEKAGWKGYRKRDAGVHPLQALVLVNYGNASGEEIQFLSQEIQASVHQKFGIQLETEVNII